MKVLKIKDLSFTYKNGVRALYGINMEANEGEVIGIFGANGSGKSTLGYCISGLIPRVIEGRLEGILEAKRAGMVLQNPDSGFFSETVREELELGPKWMGKKPSIDVAQELGIKQLLNRELKTLSGGEKKLVSIGSVLAIEPEILVLDEPFSGLDRDGIRYVRDALVKMKEKARTIIIIEQLTRFVYPIIQRAIMMENGKIVKDGKPQIVLDGCEKYGVRGI